MGDDDEDLSFSFMNNAYDSPSCCLCDSDRTSNSITIKNDLKILNKRLNDVHTLELNNDKMKTMIQTNFENENLSAVLNLKLTKLRNDISVCTEKNKRMILTTKFLGGKQNEDHTKLTQATTVKREKESSLAYKKKLLDDLHLRLHEISNVLYVERMKSALNVYQQLSLTPGIPVGGKVGAMLFAPPVTSKGPSVARAPKKDPKQPLTGCSSILSLPLPNNGEYDDVPFECTTTALAHVAHLTDAVAAALNIALPHTLLPFTSGECLVSPQYDLSVCYSLAPVMTINDRAAHSAFSWITPNDVRRNNELISSRGAVGANVPHEGVSATPHSATPAGASRTRGASFEIGSTSSTTTSAAAAAHSERPVIDDRYVLNNAFAQALTLLQANVVTLCMRAGIPPECLWPPQALLLNLAELQQLCAKCVKRNTPISTTNSNSDTGPQLALPLADTTENDSYHFPLHSLTHRYAFSAQSRSRGGGQHTVFNLVEEGAAPGGVTSAAAVWEGTAAGDDQEDYDIVSHFEEEGEEER